MLCKKEGIDVFEVGLRSQCKLWVGGAFLLTQIFRTNNIVTVILLIKVTIIDT